MHIHNGNPPVDAVVRETRVELLASDHQLPGGHTSRAQSGTEVGRVDPVQGTVLQLLQLASLLEFINTDTL